MRFLGLVIENANASDARERRRVTEAEGRRERIIQLEDALRLANARADAMVSPATVGILQDEIVQLRQMLTDAGLRTDRLVEQHHEIAMKPAPTPPTIMGSLGDMKGMQMAHPLDGFPKAQAALRVLSAGQSRVNREAMLNVALTWKAKKFTDEQLEEILYKGEGYRE